MQTAHNPKYRAIQHSTDPREAEFLTTFPGAQGNMQSWLLCSLMGCSIAPLLCWSNSVSCCRGVGGLDSSLFPPFHNAFGVDCNHKSAGPELPLPPAQHSCNWSLPTAARGATGVLPLCVLPYKPATRWFNDKLWVANALISISPHK